MVAETIENHPTRRRLRVALTMTAVVLAGFAGAGCAPLSEVQQDVREYENVDFENEFIAYRQQCMANGGRVFILANDRVDRRGIPSRGSYFTCS